MAREVKEMVAVRLDPADRRRLRVVAKRLQVSESEFLRYAIKTALEDFAPLADQAKEGAELLAAFIQHPAEKWRYLGLDVERLDEILHGDLENEGLRVEREDLVGLVHGDGGEKFHEWLVALLSGKQKPNSQLFKPAAYLREKYLVPLYHAEEAEKEEALSPRRKS